MQIFKLVKKVFLLELAILSNFTNALIRLYFNEES